MMFVQHCTACDRDQLIFPSMFTGATRTDQGLEIAYTCWCGAEQTHREQTPERPAGRRDGHSLVA